jgi:hypothetical protein
LDHWPPGVFLAPSGWRTGFIVVHKLPETPDTLWFRLFGTGNFQARAFAELAGLPSDHPYRAPLMESLANLRVILESRPSRTVNEQELFMQLSPLYLEKIAAAEQVGEQRGEQEAQAKIALKMLGKGMSAEDIASLTDLSIEQIQELQSQQG